MLDIYEIYNKKMENLVNYELTEGFETDKNELMGLNYYVAKVNEDRKCYIKPESYIILKSGKIDFQIRDENGNYNYDDRIYYDATTNGVIYITDCPYGFSIINQTLGLEKLIIDVSNYDTSKNTKMNRMFYSLISTELDVSKFDTSNVTDMSSMFQGCTYVTSLDLSNFDTRNVNTMLFMFDNCQALTSLDLSNFDTSNVTNMSRMFQTCVRLVTVNLSSFDISNVTTIWGMFSQCRSLTSLDLSSFETTKATAIDSLFNGCTNLQTVNLSNFDTSNVTNMSYMFNNCQNLTTLYLDNFDTTKITNLTNMFSGCNSLNYIRCKQSFKDWCITNQDTIMLPTQMREGGSGTWDIVG